MVHVTQDVGQKCIGLLHPLETAITLLSILKEGPNIPVTFRPRS